MDIFWIFYTGTRKFSSELWASRSPRLLKGQIFGPVRRVWCQCNMMIRFYFNPVNPDLIVLYNLVLSNSRPNLTARQCNLMDVFWIFYSRTRRFSSWLWATRPPRLLKGQIFFNFGPMQGLVAMLRRYGFILIRKNPDQILFYNVALSSLRQNLKANQTQIKA